ncbi:MAG: glycosyltransferase family 4 protein [Anaerolineales bacterium]|nr:glycosyltransferase family 4 protein [Anaerolineales bacterium]
MIPNAFFPAYGGVATSTYELARWFAKSGHQVAVIVHGDHPGLPAREGCDGFHIYRLRLSARPWLLRPLVLTSGLAQMYAILYRFRPDVVQVLFLHVNLLYPLLLSYVLPYKLVVRACGNDIHHFAARSALFRGLLRWAFRRAAQIQFNSGSLAQDAEPYLAGNEEKVVVVGEGADPDVFRGEDAFVPSNGRPYIVAIGRLVFKKGFDLLLQALTQVVQAYPDLQLLIAGDGEERHALEALVRVLKLENHVQFLGYANRKQIAAYLRGCELFVLPSRIEPVGIVVLEAMAAGKPVLVTNVGGVPDLVEHGKSGWMVAPGSHELAEGICFLLARPDLRRQLAENGHQRLRERFTWDQIAADCLEAYQRVLA